MRLLVYISRSLLKEPACAMNAFSLPVDVLKISLSEKKKKNSPKSELQKVRTLGASFSSEHLAS